MMVSQRTAAARHAHKAQWKQPPIKVGGAPACWLHLAAGGEWPLVALAAVRADSRRVGRLRGARVCSTVGWTAAARRQARRHYETRDLAYSLLCPGAG